MHTAHHFSSPQLESCGAVKQGSSPFHRISSCQPRWLSWPAGSLPTQASRGLRPVSGTQPADSPGFPARRSRPRCVIGGAGGQRAGTGAAAGRDRVDWTGLSSADCRRRRTALAPLGAPPPHSHVVNERFRFSTGQFMLTCRGLNSSKMPLNRGCSGGRRVTANGWPSQAGAGHRRWKSRHSAPDPARGCCVDNQEPVEPARRGPNLLAAQQGAGGALLGQHGLGMTWLG